MISRISYRSGSTYSKLVIGEKLGHPVWAFEKIKPAGGSNTHFQATFQALFILYILWGAPLVISVLSTGPKTQLSNISACPVTSPFVCGLRFFL